MRWYLAIFLPDHPFSPSFHHTKMADQTPDETETPQKTSRETQTPQSACLLPLLFGNE